MKQLNIILVAVLLSLTACNHNEKQIKQYAEGYLNAMGNYKPTEARPYATQETCDITISFFETIMQHTDSSVYCNNIPAKITIGKIDIFNDTTATVDFHKSTPSTQQDGSIHMVKRNGRWLVNEVLNVPSLPSSDQGPRTIPNEKIKELRENPTNKQ